MALYNYTIPIEHVENRDTLVSVTVNGIVYTPPLPFILSRQNTPLILVWLQSVLPAYLWLAEYDTNHETGLSYLNISTNCVSESTPDTMSAQILFSDVARSIAATNENCGQQTCAGITAVIDGLLMFDCDRQCLNFTDVTGVTSGGVGVINPNGYGPPNFPAIINIIQVTFTLLDSMGATLGSPYTTTYRPTAAPFASICLTAANFALTGFTGNTTYQLKYTIVTDNAITCSPLQIPFVMPCCGTVLPSGLKANVVFLQDPDSRILTFVDQTFGYATDNLGGYGTPNPAYADVSRTEFVVTTPDGNTVAFDLGYVPNAANNTAIITPQNLGFGLYSRIPDGIYKIVFNVYATPYSSECLLATETINTLLYTNTWRCLEKKIISTLHGCDLKEKQEVYNQWRELNGIIAASTTDINCINGYIERLFDKCMIDCPECGETPDNDRHNG